jgi:multidrug efflux pump subunit AcrB
MKIAEFSVKNSQFTFIVFCAVMALGLLSLINMPRAEDPKFNGPGYSVVMVYPGAGPDEIEDKLTDIIEARLGSLENIDRMRSFSDNGVAVVTIEFKHGVDTEKKYEEVVREVNAARPELPNLYRLTVERFTASDVAILQVGLISENAPYDLLQSESERLEKRLEKIFGLKGADIWAFPKKEVKIDLNLAKMSAEGIPINRIFGALQSENISIPGGDVSLGDRQFFVKTSGDYEHIDEIKNTIINANAGKIIYLKDIADINFAYETPKYLARTNGNRCVFVTARMKDGQNITQVGKEVNAALKDFEADLPQNIDMVRPFDQNDSVQKRLVRFSKDFGIAILLVLLTLLPLGLRAAFVVMISIPLSISLGLFALDKLGYSLNQLSIVGLIISLGILVDDSIVVVENIERWLRDGYKRQDAAILATKQIGLAVLGCTATLILAFLPLVFLPEAAGDFIRSLPMAVVTTVIASLFVSLTIVPFLSSRMLSDKHDPRGNFVLRGMKWLISVSYARLLNYGLKHPKMTLLASTIIFAGVMSIAGRAGFTIFPASERPMFMINIEGAPGTNFLKTDATVRMVDSVLQTYIAPEFKNHHLHEGNADPISIYPGGNVDGKVTWFMSNIGRGNPRMYYNVIPRNDSPDFAQIIVQLQEKTPPPIKIRFIDMLREKFKDIPGVSITVKNFEQGPPIEAPVVVRLFGENLDTLRSSAALVDSMIANTEGTIYVNNSIATIKTDLSIKINKDKAVTMGIPIAEIDRMVRLSIAGLNMGIFTAKNDGKEYNITLGLAQNEANKNLDVLKNLYINTITGASIPLYQIAEIEMSRSPNTIGHYNKERYTIVSAFVKSGYMTTDINAKIIKNMADFKLPKGYHYQVAGEVESSQRSFGGLGTTILVTIFGLLAVLILEFKTFKSTLIVLSVIPLGMIGAVLILLITGYPFSFTVVVGLIALMGIEVKNSILLVDFTNQLRAEGRGLDEAIQEAGEIRFVPILLTSLTAIGGLIPLAIEENPLYSPLAYVLIGGLISSTLLSRIVTPVMYKLLAPKYY